MEALSSRHARARHVAAGARLEHSRVRYRKPRRWLAARADLFFPLPVDAQSPGSIPAFETTTRFHVGAALVAQVTPFARIETDEVDTYEPVSGYAYWDSPYSYNTTYVGFRGVAVLPPAYWGHPVFAHPYRWSRPGYYRGGAPRGGFRGGGGFHGGGGHGGGGHGGGHR